MKSLHTFHQAALRTLNRFVPLRHVIEAAPARRAVIANELKYKAPHAHTMLELVYVRWGRAAHIVYFFFAVLTNLLVSLSMLQGGAPAPAHDALRIFLTWAMLSAGVCGLSHHQDGLSWSALDCADPVSVSSHVS